MDTPLAPYFSDNLTSEDLDEMNIEVGSRLWGRLWWVGGWVVYVGAVYAKPACPPLPLSTSPQTNAAPRSCFYPPPLPSLHPQVMRNMLYKAYLDDFASFVHRVGGTTGEVMGELLSFEARRQ